MKMIVTCGPSFEPIDRVRRLTNFSTGELGVLLSGTLAASGHEVVCLKGSGATAPDAPSPVHTVHFDTNDDLQHQLEARKGDAVGAIFHVAALCDFRVTGAVDTAGNRLASDKIPSRLASLTLTLEPARKVISSLRSLFPKAKIVGWKYEMDGGREQALARGASQIAGNGIDACVVNGAAYGAGFGFCTAAGLIQHCADKKELCCFVTHWIDATASV